jgi:hypothetical protein
MQDHVHKRSSQHAVILQILAHQGLMEQSRQRVTRRKSRCLGEKVERCHATGVFVPGSSVESGLLVEIQRYSIHCAYQGAKWHDAVVRVHIFEPFRVSLFFENLVVQDLGDSLREELI